jgi:hypothetical protein
MAVTIVRNGCLMRRIREGGLLLYFMYCLCEVDTKNWCFPDCRLRGGFCIFSFIVVVKPVYWLKIHKCTN